MEGRISVTESQLIDALREATEAGGDTDGALTAGEIADLIGKNVRTTREMIRRAKAAGRIEVVDGLTRLRIDDEPYTTKGYRPVDAA